MRSTNQNVNYNTSKQEKIKSLKIIIDANYSFFEKVKVKDPAQVESDIDLFGGAFLDEKGNSIYPLNVKGKK